MGNELYIVQGKEICVVNEISIFVSSAMIYAMVKESVEYYASDEASKTVLVQRDRVCLEKWSDFLTVESQKCFLTSAFHYETRLEVSVMEE